MEVSYNFIDPTDHSHPIVSWVWMDFWVFRQRDKIDVSSVKEPYKIDNILRKRPILVSILLTVATP